MAEADRKSPSKGITKCGDPRCARLHKFVQLKMVLVVVIMTGLLGVAMAEFGINPKFIWSFNTFVAALVGAPLVWHFRGKHLENLAEDVLTYHLRVCIACGYSLQGLKTNTRCPECGFETRDIDIESIWDKWLRKNHPTRSAHGRRLWDDYLRKSE